MSNLKTLNDYKDLEVGEIVKLPNGDTGKVLEITGKGVMVFNFNEERRIQKMLYKKIKCDYCKKIRFNKDLFKEDIGRKYKCKECCDLEIRQESKEENLK